MPAYESMGWPLGMFGEFWAWWKGNPKWLDIKEVIANLAKPKDDSQHYQVCIIVGAEDMMIDVDMCRLQAAQYRQALEERQAKGDRSRIHSVEGAEVESFGGVALAIVQDAGHHSQNDVQSKVAAEVLFLFLQQA